VGTTSVRPITIKDKNHVMHILKNTPEFLPPEVNRCRRVNRCFSGRRTELGLPYLCLLTWTARLPVTSVTETPLDGSYLGFILDRCGNDKQGTASAGFLMKHAEDDYSENARQTDNG